MSAHEIRSFEQFRDEASELFGRIAAALGSYLDDCASLDILTQASDTLNGVDYRGGEFTNAQRQMLTRLSLLGDAEAFVLNRAARDPRLADLHNATVDVGVGHRNRLLGQVLAIAQGVAQFPSLPHLALAREEPVAPYEPVVPVGEELDVLQVNEICSPLRSTIREDGKDAGENVPFWIVGSPPASRMAASPVADAEARISTADMALPDVHDRMSAMLRKDRSYSMLMVETGPEAGFMQMMRFVDSDTRTLSLVDSRMLLQWKAMAGKFLDWLESLYRFVAYCAWIRTPGQASTAWTIVSWGGDSASVFARSAQDRDLSVHARTLAVAVQTREHLVETLVEIIRMAQMVLGCIAAPWKIILLLPAIWRFLKQIVSEHITGDNFYGGILWQTPT